MERDVNVLIEDEVLNDENITQNLKNKLQDLRLETELIERISEIQKRAEKSDNLLLLEKRDLDSFKKITKTTKISNYEVLTDDGFVEIESLHETIPYDVYHLKLRDGKELKCADNHIVFNENLEEVFVKDLNVGDKVVITYYNNPTENLNEVNTTNLSEVIEVTNLGYKEVMFDLELSEDSDRRYYTNGILSHNTFLAKKLAKEIFGSEESMIRVDMSEYQEKHTISRLIGSPPGYVGHEEGGQLTEQVKNKPYCVVLFDEIEKAHKDIFSTLLQMLDDGHLTDSLGRKINFKNCLIIMTSNIGVRKLQDFGSGMGFKSSDYVQEEHKRDILKKELRKFFAPEFLNRIDDVIIFNPLDKDNIDRIVKLEIDNLLKRLIKLNYNFTMDNSVIDLISKVGFDEQYGARPLKRAIQDKIEDYISEGILDNNIKENVNYTLVAEDDTVKVIVNEITPVEPPKKRGRKKKE